ncbi:hypothetical protein IFM89_035455 [Coptis chinensis]|uniref:Uncharacterized protein n=1 Tax=Coptis chinensis TaxID=261450 RepID=A0A835IWQ4_9MAGN|nr:hypothetical protein IFM89_035455 [Coptis chinensis]
MGRFSVCQRTGFRKGAWTAEEDRLLTAYITRYGHWNWRELPRFAGLSRCGKSCRLRWMNYLRPNIKRGNYSREEEKLIITLHEKLGNKWSAIAAGLPGRTDNEIKNHWHTHLKKRSEQYTTSMKEGRRKHVRCATFAKTESVPKSVYPNTVTPLILESSTVVPKSPQQSSDISSLTADSEALSYENHIKDETPQGSCPLLSSPDDYEVLSYRSEIMGDIGISSEPVLFGESFWTEPFLVQDSDMHLSDDQLVDPLLLFSLSQLEEGLNLYDLYDGLSMEFVDRQPVEAIFQ